MKGGRDLLLCFPVCRFLMRPCGCSCLKKLYMGMSASYIS
ncbi:hypothetical protein HMPREF3038_01744 [Akkermansia sp. KLE1797]|nr:hypothetical protein HMPREF3038_01744 [Akkermansia sp. KLE1797]KXU53949.1 hypothetical protein HMPREF3039_01904 [Akkermansia sp. KLE1798]KZA03127.1 hypothetical protein HMPREF1326_03171 [Akkermansia sp. KLE1605]